MPRQHTSPNGLVAFALDRETLSPSAQRHLNNCPLCQHQVACYRKIAAYLLLRLYRSGCPSAATLSYYCLPGALPDEERRLVAEHLARCPRCAAECAESRQFLRVP